MASKRKQQSKKQPDERYMSVEEARTFLDQWAAWVNALGPTGRPRWEEARISDAVYGARDREKRRKAGRAKRGKVKGPRELVRTRFIALRDGTLWDGKVVKVKHRTEACRRIARESMSTGHGPPITAPTVAGYVKDLPWR